MTNNLINLKTTNSVAKSGDEKCMCCCKPNIEPNRLSADINITG